MHPVASLPRSRVRLPTNLAKQIFAYCPQSTLFACLFLSRAYGAEAARELYSRPEVGPYSLDSILDALAKGVAGRSIFKYHHFMRQSLKFHEPETVANATPAWRAMQAHKVRKLMTTGKIRSVHLEMLYWPILLDIQALERSTPSSISRLRFSQCTIDRIGWQILLANHPNLCELELVSCSAPDDVGDHGRRKLERLVLVGCTVSASWILDCAQWSPMLRSIDMVRLPLVDGTILGELLIACTELKVLRLYGVRKSRHIPHLQLPPSRTSLSVFELDSSGWMKDDTLVPIVESG